MSDGADGIAFWLRFGVLGSPYRMFIWLWLNAFLDLITVFLFFFFFLA